MLQQVAVEVENGGAKAGNWWVNVGTATGHLTVEWSPQRNFGLYEQTEEPIVGAQPLDFFADPALMLRQAMCPLGGSSRVSVILTRQPTGKGCKMYLQSKSH